MRFDKNFVEYMLVIMWKGFNRFKILLDIKKKMRERFIIV